MTNTWTIEKHRKFVAKTLLLGWVPQHKRAMQMFKDNTDRIKPEWEGDTLIAALARAKAFVTKQAADLLVNSVVKQDDLRYYFRLYATFVVQQGGRCRILLGGIEETLSPI